MEHVHTLLSVLDYYNTKVRGISSYDSSALVLTIEHNSYIHFLILDLKILAIAESLQCRRSIRVLSFTGDKV